MANQRISIRKIREIARLGLHLGYSDRLIAASCNIGKTTAGDCLRRLEKAGLSWPLPDDLDDAALEAKLYPTTTADECRNPAPDWSLVAHELKKKGVTRLLLWQEYIDQYPSGLSYSTYCETFNRWQNKSRISMRQRHTGGDKLFVDFAGKTIGIHDPIDGTVRQAQIFVAVWGASNFTYVEAVWSQDLASWIGCHVRAFEFFGCVPNIIVPDNLKAGVSTSCRYDPDINPTFAEFARHYGTAVIPARSRKPKDKAKAEVGVLISTRWIIAALRKRRFFSLDELNTDILRLLEGMNKKPFQKLPGCRFSTFEEVDRPAEKSLPSQAYVYAEIIKARVNIDYHVSIDDHFYSTPYQLRGEVIHARVTATTVEILHKNQRICTHARSYQKWGFSTIRDHMPEAHRAHSDWTPSRIIDWANRSGKHTASLVAKIMSERDHPEQGYCAALGIIRLGERYGTQRLDEASARALSFGTHRYSYVKSILVRQLDLIKTPTPPSVSIVHENIRGGHYYSSKQENTNVDQRDNDQAECSQALRHGEGL